MVGEIARKIAVFGMGWLFVYWVIGELFFGRFLLPLFGIYVRR